jgi:hypothetical protein
MKLLYCPACGDMFSLAKHTKACGCKLTFGYYVDNNNVVYSYGIPFSIGNQSFDAAIERDVPEKSLFFAWLPAKDHSNWHKL